MAAGWTALVLLSVAGAGSALDCMESKCFPHERADCADPEAAEVKACDRETAFYVMRRKLGVEHVLRVNTSVPFNCVKFIGTSSELGMENKKMTLRLCHPKVDNQCAMMERIFDDAIRRTGVMDLQMSWECVVCREDRCNGAPGAGGGGLTAAAAAAAAVLLLGRPGALP
ncbi:uncharacterized protein LOC134528086 isoform X2 [Bacillus rossius redtenbacheri]|uniref:uncharacterized protein LOC134528086 isoform X2 n=1 Tax=Bacillus rossius redtenbacheri TaxID=93214 RepID=UPI002FDE02DB